MPPAIAPYAAVVLKLLSGVLYSDDKDWDRLLSYQSAVHQHFASIGLRLTVDEAEGFAYLTQPDSGAAEEEEGLASEDAPPLPRLVRRTPLSYQATLLCVLLREELLKFDAHEPDQTRLVLSADQVRELIAPFYAERSDMTRTRRKIDSAINQVIQAGFLRELPGATEELYEVQRIIKAKLSSEVLAEIQASLFAAVEKAGSDQAHEEDA